MRRRIFTLFLFGLAFSGQTLADVPAEDRVPMVSATASSLQDDPFQQLLGPLPEPSVDVWARLRSGFKMPALDSSRVEAQTNAIARNPEAFAKTAERAGMYLYYIVGQVEARGMPMELALLPFVESSFKPTALSPARASGLWQFIPSTGTQYSLDQNLWKDERRDVVESTRAALDYFQKLYAQFNDWQLALAAYNWGEGNVQRAVDRNVAQGLPGDYSHIRMPQETANYVPRLEAVKRIVQNPSAYGVELPDIGSEPYFVQVFRDKDIDLKTAAKLAGMQLEDFKKLNPGFNRPVIVGAHDSAMLIPADNLDEFLENMALWRSNGKRISSWKTRRYQKGESLADIALDTGMSEDELREVNRIPGNRRIAENSLLLVRADANAPREEIEGGDSFFRLEPIPSVPKIQYRQIHYRVRKGDTVEGIADRLNVTPRSIIVANRLRSSKLKRGMSLAVTVPVIRRNVGTAEVRAYREARGYRLNAMDSRQGNSRRSVKSAGKRAAGRSSAQKARAPAKKGGQAARRAVKKPRKR